MYCTRCGASNTAAATYCTKCGYNLANPALSVAGAVVKPVPPYSSIRGLSISLAIMFGILLLVTIVAVVSDLFQVQLLDRIASGLGVTDAEATANDLRQAIIGSAYFLINIAVVVLFLVWIHHAHRNLRSLGAEGLDYSPGWAVGGFFIPIMNLFRPYQVTREIWKGSDPDFSSTDGMAWKSVRLTPLLGWWWALYLITGVVGNAVLRASFNTETLESIQSFANVTLVSDILLVPAIILAVAVVLGIDRRQARRHGAQMVVAAN